MSGAWGQGYGDGWEGEDEEGGQGRWGGGGKLIEGSVAMRRGYGGGWRVGAVVRFLGIGILEREPAAIVVGDDAVVVSR